MPSYQERVQAQAQAQAQALARAVCTLAVDAGVRISRLIMAMATARIGIFAMVIKLAFPRVKTSAELVES